MNKKLNTTSSIFNKYTGRMLIGLLVVFLSGFFVTNVFAAINTLVLTSPMGVGNYWAGSQNITWDYTDDGSGGDISISLSSDGGSNYNEFINGVDVTSGSYSWDTTSNLDGTLYKIRIKTSTIEYSSDENFTIDNTDPTFTVNEGTDSGPVQTDTINVTTDDATSGVASQEYGFSADNICDSNDTIITPFDSGVNFDITGDNTDYLCVKATDNAGNIAYELVGQLNTDNTAPTVLSYTLDGGSVDAYFNPTAPDTMAIEITADESVTWTTIRIQDVATGAIQKDYHPATTGITGSESWDGSLSVGSLAEGAYELYYTIEDMAGNVTGPIAGPLGTHHIIVDTVVPTMTSVVATTVQGGGDTIEVTFSEDVVAVDGDWTDGNELGFVSPVGTTVVTTNATFSFDAPTNVLTVTLDETTDESWLKNGQLLSAFTTGNKIEDLAGNQLTASKDDSSIDGDIVAPTVVLMYDIDRQVKDADTIEITATFSEEMDNTPQIAIATAGDGSLLATDMTMGTDRTEWTYSWDVPSGADDDGTATITITGEDLAGNTITDGTNTRVIDNTDPTIDSFTKPVDDIVYRIDTILTFIASDTGTGTGPVCTYSLNSGADVTTTCTETDLAVAGLAEGRNTIEVTVIDEAGNTDTSVIVSFVYDTDGILTVDDTSTTNPDFPTIQEAIDAWVTGITTIDIASGTYTESGQILIDMDLIITGDSVNKPIITPATDFTGNNAADAWILIDPSITFNIDNVVFDGGTQFVWQALRSHGNTTVDAVDFKNIVGSASGSPYRGIAIQGYGGVVVGGGGSDSHGGAGLAFSHLVVKNSTFTNIGRIGVLLKGVGATADITNNTYIGKGSGDWLDYGFEVGAGGSASIKNNTISDNRGVASADDSTSAGILITTYWGAGSNATVEENTFTDNSTAIFVGYDNADTSVVTARYNNMNNNNDFGVEVTAATTNVDVEKNWWGDATGPQHVTANPAGLGADVTDDADFSPFCVTVPVGASCNLGSIDPIVSFDLNFDSNPQAVNNPSTLTITARDALGYLVVNDSTTQIKLDADSGASFGSTPITMEEDGDVTTTITNTIIGTVNVTAEEWPGGPATGAGTIEFIAGSDVTAPIISNVQVTNITTTGATITWTTDEVSKSQVEYGTTSSYGTLTTVDATMVTSHSVILTGLTSGTDYHFRVISMDASSNVATSGDNLFTTVGVDTIPPVITLLGQNPVTLTTGDTYVEAKATASDNVDGDLSTSIVIDNSAVNTSAAGTYIVTYNVSDSAENVAVEEKRTVIVTDPAVTPVIPTITLNGAAIVPSYTVSEATTRFTTGLQFDTTNAVSVTVNGSSITPASTVTAETMTEATALGLHVYNLVVTSSTGDTANTTVSYEVTADFDDTASLVVTGIDAVNTYATADDTFENGWSWTFHVTVPTNETHFKMKFADFVSGVNSITSANNVRFYTVQSSDSYDESTATMITATDTYSNAITLNADLESGTAGRQIDVTVEMKVPTGSAGGSYSASYGINSEII